MISHSIESKSVLAEKFEDKMWLTKTCKNWREISHAFRKNTAKLPVVFKKSGLRVFFTEWMYEYILLVEIKEIFFDWIYLNKGFYTPKSEHTIIDLGAHMGLFALFCQTQVPEKVKVHCFEPLSDNLKYLNKNVMENNFQDWIKIYPYAICDRKTTKKLKFGASPSSVSFFPELVTTEENYLKQPVEVKCLSLNEVLEITKAKKVDFLKIHCEGSEIEILKGASPETMAKIHKIAVVFHNHVRPQCDRHLITSLQAHNFEIKSVKNIIVQLNIGLDML